MLTIKKAFLLFLFLACSGILFAQSNAIKFNVISPFVKVINMSYEHAFSAHSSIQLTVYKGRRYYDIYDEKDGQSYGFVFDYRYALVRNYLQGSFISPFVRYSNLKVQNVIYNWSPNWGANNKIAKESASFLSFGFVLGYQFLVFNNFTLEGFFGPSYDTLVDYSSDYESYDSKLRYERYINDNYSFRLGINFGFAF